MPDELWAIVEPLLPRFAPRAQGGGTAPVDARALFTAVVYVLTSGCAWRQLPAVFNVDYRTAHRRFGQWTRAGLWQGVREATSDAFAHGAEADWSRAILDGARSRARQRTKRPGRRSRDAADTPGSTPRGTSASASSYRSRHTDVYSYDTLM